MDIDQTRTNMVDQQIRTQQVTDKKILSTFSKIPREDFVPDEYHALAFAETEIPLGHDQFMLPPSIEGRLLQTLQVQPHETVLEIGTGSGYFTAMLAALAKHVYSVEFFESLTEEAQEKLRQHHIYNTTLVTADAAQGFSEHGPFDAIVITGSLPVLPEDFKKCLNTGGRLLAILGDAPAMEATLFTRLSSSEWKQESVFETCVPPLLNAQQPERFEF